MHESKPKITRSSKEAREFIEIGIKKILYENSVITNDLECF